MTQILDSLLVEGNAQSTAQGLFLGGVTEMPEPAEGSRGCMVFYAGPAGPYTPFSFYQCVTDDDGATFYWHPMVLSLDLTYEKAENAVTKDTTINGHPLTGDITITTEDIGAMPLTTRIPTKVSELSNDGVYITQDCSTMSNYWTKQQTSKVLESYCRILIVDEFPDDDAIDAHALYSVPQNGIRRMFYRANGEWVSVA